MEHIDVCHNIPSRTAVSLYGGSGDTAAISIISLIAEGGIFSMHSTENKSEIARIRELIALEYESVERAIKGLSVTSRHDFIAKRQQNIQGYVEDLAVIVGEREATRMAFESCLGIV